MAEKGSLVVFVTTARSAIPVQDARVSIFKPDTKQLLGFRRTNAEGIASRFETTTPNIDLSLTPQNPDNAYETPFAIFDVQVDHPKYQSVLIEDVQVFSDRESIQNVDLIPLAEYADENNLTETFPIPPQSL